MSQTRVTSPELPNIETSPRNVTIDSREEPRRPPETASSHWSPLPPPVRTQQTALEQTHISPMNDAVAIVVEKNPYTFNDNGVPIDLVRRIVVAEKRRILLNMRVDVSASSVLSTPIQDRSTRGDIDRPLQTYANIVAILSERLKTRLCIVRPRIHTRRPQIRSSALRNSRIQYSVLYRFCTRISLFFCVGTFSLFVILDIHCTRSLFCCISKYSHTELSIV